MTNTQRDAVRRGSLAGVALVAAARAGGVRQGRAGNRARRSAAGDAAPPPRVLAPVEQPLEAAPARARGAGRAGAARAGPAAARRGRRRHSPGRGGTRPEPEPAPLPPARRSSPGASCARRPRPPTPPPNARCGTCWCRARAVLGRVDYRRLSPEGRSQYEQAQALLRAGRRRSAERNFPFAATLADKAATLASQLGG